MLLRQVHPEQQPAIKLLDTGLGWTDLRTTDGVNGHERKNSGRARWQDDAGTLFGNVLGNNVRPHTTVALLLS